MFNKKATSHQLEDFAGLMGNQNRLIWEAIEDLRKAQREDERRLDRYALQLTKIIGDLTYFSGVIDHNATQSQNDQDRLKDAYGRLEELRSAVGLLSIELGKEFTVLPEVETTVTIQPGLPERLGLVKAPKGKKKSELPPAIELTASELNSGLALVGQYGPTE